jgi:hypothetical protein
MALYFTSNTNATTPAQQNLGSSPKTMTAVTALTATLRRAFIYEFDVGTSGTPNATDCAITWDLVAITSTGTGTVGVTNPLDQADAATSMASTINNTAEGITTANSQRWALSANQRASYRWVVNPGGPGELVVPATNVAGLAIRAASPTYASTANAGVYLRE